MPAPISRPRSTACRKKTCCRRKCASRSARYARLVGGRCAAALAGAAGWQWWEADTAKSAALAAEQVATEQKGIAETQRDRAEQNLALARKAADDLVFQIAQGLREVQGMPLELLRQILDSGKILMDQLARAVPGDLRLKRSRGAMFIQFSLVFRSAGDLARAREAADQAVVLMREVAAIEPHVAQWQIDVSVALGRVASLRRAAGDRVGALAALEESLAIARKVSAAESGKYKLATRCGRTN